MFGFYSIGSLVVLGNKREIASGLRKVLLVKLLLEIVLWEV